MKRPKSYHYRIATLLIVIGSVCFLYWYGYHKVFEEKCIPQNADRVIVADAKNIRNYFAVSYLKNPSEWQWNKPETKFEKLSSLSDFGIKTPDYFAFFHIENQPGSQWFISLKIENETTFEKAITKTNFNKTELQNGMSSYYSKSKALFIVKHSNQILVSNISEKQKQIALQTAENLFIKKLFLDTKRIEKTIDTNNAVTFWIKKNSILEKDGILNLKLEDNEITVDGFLALKPKFKKEFQFSKNPNALLSLGFNFEMIRGQNILKQNSAKINKMLGFDLDSILVRNPTKTELVLNKIIEKKDSAISYDYDDDFNPIKKVTVSTNREPSFYFSIQTVDSKKVYDYLKTQNTIDNHSVFVNFPLAQTKAFVEDNSFKLEANLTKTENSQISVPKIGYLYIHLDKLKTKDWRFIIAKNKIFSFFQSFETLKINLSPKNNLIHFQARLKAKDRKNLISIMK